MSGARARQAAALGALLAACALLLAPLVVHAQSAPARKVALVIGNAEYDGNVLDNPEHDAAAVTARLKALGFSVTTGTNLGRAGMGSLIAQFVDGVGDGDLVLIFYAGHGVEVGGQTYLIPVDARMLSPSAPRFEGVPVEQLWSFAKRPYGTVILFDACRDSPFLNRVRGDVAGAHAASTPPNTLVLFSSSSGRPASDGTGSGPDSGHSLFTAALLQALDAPDTSLDQVVRTTTRSVRATSSDGQIPQRYGGLDQDFAFSGRAPPAPVTAPAPVTVAILPPPVAAPPIRPEPSPAKAEPVKEPAKAEPAPEPEAEPASAPLQVASAPMPPSPLRSLSAPHPAPIAAVAGAPPPPVLRGLTLETVAAVDIPASFCSVEEKYAFIAKRQKPANEAAMRNHAAAIAYKAELGAMYVKYRDATPGGSYSGNVMAELKRVGAVADDTFARAGETQRLFDTIMAVPVTGRCRA